VIGHLTRRVRETNRRLEQEMDARGLNTGRGGGGAGGALATSKPEDHGRIDLRSLKCFEGFSMDEMKALVKAAPARTYRDGNDLCRQGDQGNSCFIIARGAVNVVRHMSGSDRTLATLQKGTLVGQMALVDRAPRSATIRAHGDCVVLELKRDAFEQLLAAASPFAMRFQHQIATAGIRQLRAANGRLTSVISTAQRTAPKPKPGASAPRPGLPRPPRPAGARPPAPLSGLSRGLPPKVQNRPSAPAKTGLGGKLKSVFSKIPSGAPIGGDEIPEVDRKRGKPTTEREQEEMLLAYMQAALGEWDMDMSDLDSVKSVRPAGSMSAAEKKSRGL
jgi:CRP-like cAMP-binding protein